MATKIFLPNESLPSLLSYWIGKSSNAFAAWELMLWSNSAYSPSQGSVFGDLVEATFGGYARFTLTQPTWTSPTVISDKAVSTYGVTPLSWTVTSSPQTLYGYAIITPSSSKIIAIQAFDAAIPLVTGGILGVLPRLEFTTEP